MSTERNSNFHDASDWLLKLQDEKLSPQQISEWVEWSQADPQRLAAFEQVKDLWTDIKGLDAARKEAALRRLVPDRLSPPRRTPPARYAWAAAIVLALLAATVGGWQWQQHIHQIALDTRYATLKAEARHVQLPDGTRMDLGASTQAHVLYNAQARVVELTEGEAFFRVASDSNRPFSVHAGNWRLKDIGTAFNVRKTQDRLIVTVAEGIVDVEAPHERSAPLRLNAGEQAAMGQGDKPARIARVDAKTASSWQQGQLQFNDEPLSVVLANLNRYASREIVIADPAVADMRFSGTVLTDHINGWLAATCRVFGLRSESGDGSHVLLYRDSTSE